MSNKTTWKFLSAKKIVTGCLITFVVIGISIISYVLYFFAAIEKTTPPTYITERSLGVKGSIKFFYISSSLSASFIQVRKIDNETKKEYILENYESYDNMVGYCLKGDSLTVFLKKGYSSCTDAGSKCDTFKLNVNDISTEYILK
jgi:hypothetical protein